MYYKCWFLVVEFRWTARASHNLNGLALLTNVWWWIFKMFGLNLPTFADFTSILHFQAHTEEISWKNRTGCIKHQTSKVQAAVKGVLRMIRGVTRLDKKRNEEIRERLDISSVLTIIEKNKFKWFEYEQRMSIQYYPDF